MRNNFFSQKRGRFCCSSGSGTKDVYSPLVRDDGTIDLVVTGQVDTDAEIESYAESVSIQNIIARFKHGDQSALNRRTALFLDLTEFPQTYAEVLQLGINAENRFNELPVEVKQQFDNNWRVWLASTGTEEWFKSFGLDFKSSDEKVDEQKEESSNES